MNTKKTSVPILFLSMVLASPVVAQEKIDVVATLECLGSMVDEVGGDRVSVTCLARGFEDPHFVLPTPTLMIRANHADLFVEVGMSLEIWAERVLDGARNTRIRRGAVGHVYAYEGIEALEVPTQLTRAEGDIHPQGNPHIWLDPSNARIMAANIARGLSRVDPEHAGEYKKRLADFQRRIDEAMYGRELIDLLGLEYIERLQKSGELLGFLAENDWEGKPLLERLGGWRRKMLPLRNAGFVTYHKAWAYFGRAFDVDFVGQLEPKPGISPTPAHLAHVKSLIRSRKVRSIVCAPYYDFQKARSVAEETGIKAIKVPSEVGGDDHCKDYFSLIDRIVDLFCQTRGD